MCTCLSNPFASSLHCTLASVAISQRSRIIGDDAVCCSVFGDVFDLLHSPCYCPLALLHDRSTVEGVIGHLLCAMQ